MDHALVQSYVRELRSKDEAVRLAAAQHLGSLGERAVEAIPTLVNSMEDEDNDVALAVCEALKQIGKAGVPHLLHFMRNTHEEEKFRWYAAEALADLGPDSLPFLLRAMDDEDVGVRMMAIDAVPRIGIAAEASIPKIAGFLDGRNPGLANASAFSLGRIALCSADPGISPAMKLLLKALKGKDAALRRAVISAFESIGERISGIRPAVEALKEATQDEDEEVRDGAAWLLSSFGNSESE